MLFATARVSLAVVLILGWASLGLRRLPAYAIRSLKLPQANGPL